MSLVSPQPSTTVCKSLQMSRAECVYDVCVPVAKSVVHHDQEYR